MFRAATHISSSYRLPMVIFSLWMAWARINVRRLTLSVLITHRRITSLVSRNRIVTQLRTRLLAPLALRRLTRAAFANKSNVLVTLHQRSARHRLLLSANECLQGFYYPPGHWHREMRSTNRFA